MFKKQFQQIINSLGLMQKAKDRQLTKEDWESISDSYKETYGVDFYEDMQQAKEKAGEADRLSKEHAQALEILNAMEENTGSDKESGDLLEKMNKFAAGMQKISKENADLKAALDAMASAAVPGYCTKKAVCFWSRKHRKASVRYRKPSVQHVQTLE